MSETRDKIIQSMKADPENAADAAIQLQKEFTALQQQLEQQAKSIADLQRLCERALIILSEHWDKLTDNEGYGYTSLESALKKAASGKEYKDLTLLSNACIRSNSEKDKSIGELKARIGELEKVVEAAKKAMSLCVPEAATEDEFYKALNNLNQPDKG